MCPCFLSFQKRNFPTIYVAAFEESRLKYPYILFLNKNPSIDNPPFLGKIFRTQKIRANNPIPFTVSPDPNFRTGSFFEQEKIYPTCLANMLQILYQKYNKCKCNCKCKTILLRFSLSKWVCICNCICCCQTSANAFANANFCICTCRSLDGWTKVHLWFIAGNVGKKSFSESHYEKMTFP